MIRIGHLVKRFGRSTAVGDVSLTVGDGESIALWGANGAGKTTIIRCVLGLLDYQGTITVGGLDARREGKAARALIGYVPQELGFYDDLRVHEAVCLFASLKRIRVRNVSTVLGPVGLDGHERKQVRQLSGGMKQRLALAIALLGDPPMLVLDEVTASLDACGRREFVTLLSHIAGGSGGDGARRVMLFASHRPEEVQALATRVVLLESGRIATECSPQELVDRLGAGSELHIHMDSLSRRRAIEFLQFKGFDARMNGTGILVPVAASRKSVPLRLLAEAQIPLTDFDLVPGPAGGGSMKEKRA